MATYIFDGSQSLRIESFDIANDRLIVDFTADEVVSVENFQGSASLTLANGTSLVFVGLTYADLAEADILPDDLLIIASDEDQQPSGNPIFNGVLNGAIVAALGGSVAVANDGEDLVVGLTGDDLLLGNMGDDTVFGGGGNDRLYGGMGDDLILAGQEFDGDLEGAFENGGLETSSDVELFVAGGLGQDTIVVGGDFDFGLPSIENDDGNVSGSVTIYGGDSNADPADEADLILVGLADNATALVTGNGGDDEIGIYGEGSATVYGGQGDDDIFAEVESGVFFGNLGEDTITVFASEGATVYGGQNDDVIDANFGSDSLIFGNLGDDEISLNENEDSDLDDIGSATVYGGQGDDTITGFLGDGSAVYGGAGADEIDVSIVDGDATVIGGNGGDNAGDTDDLITVDLDGDGNQSAFVTGNLGDDEIRLEGFGEFTVYGGQGDDTITTELGDGELGDDSAIYGGQGSDTLDLFVDGDDVVIFGGTGLGDTGDAADTITVDVGGGVEDLAIYGNGGDDTIVVSGGGEVSVFGGVGEDTIGFGDGASGDYTLTGGAGADVFDLTNVAGDALIDIDISLDGSDTGASITITDFNADEDQIAVGEDLLDIDVLDTINLSVDGQGLLADIIDTIGSAAGGVVDLLDTTLDAVFSLAADTLELEAGSDLAVTFEFDGQQYLAIGTTGDALELDLPGLPLPGLPDLGDLLPINANVTALINITGYTGTIDADVFTA